MTLPVPAILGAAQAQDTVTVTGTRIASPTSSSITVSGQALQQDGITGLFQLGQVVPGLRVDSYGGNTQPTLRGIGVQNVLGPGVNSDVAIYVDGFYQTSLDAGVFDFADIASVNVLKGPQGILFGQNATGGAILLATADPAFKTRGWGAVTYGSFNDRRLQGYVTGGLTDTLAADFSINSRQSDNYFTDNTSGKPSAKIDNLSLRSKLLFEPAQGTRMVLSAQYSDTNDPSGLAYMVRNPVASLYHDFYAVPQTYSQTPFKTSFDQRIAANSKIWALGLAGDFDLGWGALTSRTQIRQQRAHVRADLDGTSIPYWTTDYVGHDQTIAQELNLVGKGDGRLQWQAGLYYDNDLGALADDTVQDIFSTGTNTSLFKTHIRVATDSLALFGNVTYSLADDWLVSAGARATHERKSMRSADFLPPFTPGADTKAWDELTPRLALRHVLNDNANIYVSVTRGFMSGNYNYLGIGSQAPVKPEHVTQYEAGYKYADAAWTIDAAAYLSDYKDLETYTYAAGCGCFQFSNAPHAEVHGVEISARGALDENFSVNAALAYTHARYLQFTGENPTGQPFIPPFYGYATGPTDFAGDSMIRSPDWSGNVGLDWRFSNAAGSWIAAANLYLTSRVPFTPDRQLSQAGYALLNLSIGWTAPDAHWSVLASGQNVTDQRYQTFSAAGFLGNSIVYGAPASWNLRVERSF